jgi:hypothetical protein
VERIAKSLKALAAASLLLVLTTCWNPIDFVAKVTDEVMQATDKYLAIESTNPAASASDVNPWGAIEVTFDRALDLATISTSSIVLEPFVSWTPSYNSSTHTLSIKPSAFASQATTYTVTITKDLKGADASSLRDVRAWSFTTRAAAGGSISITGNISNLTKYCSSANITVTIDYNPMAKYYRISTTDPPTFRADKFDYKLLDGTSPDTATAPAPYFDPLPAGDGSKTVYIQFMDDDNAETPSTAISDSVVLDTNPPDVTIGTYPSYLNIASPSVQPGATAWDENGVSCLWTQPEGTANAVTFSSTSVVNPTISAAVDNGTGVKVHLRATDPAGNSTELAGTAMSVDSVAPLPPTISGPGSATTNTTPTFTWTHNGTGSRIYEYSVDGGAYSAEAGDETYTASFSAYGGSHSFRVMERDWLNNWGNPASYSTFVYPTWLLPEHGAIVDRSPRVQWWSGATTLYTFTIYVRRYKVDKTFTVIDPKLYTTTYYADLPAGFLDADTIYQWYIERTYGVRTYRYPSGTDYFSFRTNSTK